MDNGWTPRPLAKDGGGVDGGDKLDRLTQQRSIEHATSPFGYPCDTRSCPKRSIPQRNDDIRSDHLDLFPEKLNSLVNRIKSISSADFFVGTCAVLLCFGEELVDVVVRRADASDVGHEALAARDAGFGEHSVEL